jgi:DNA ligase (NAD+)
MKPTTCPSCHDPLFTEEGVVDQYCRNEECPSRRIESIVHFIARDGMNIEGFSERQVIKFIELGFINSIADVYRIKKEDLIDLDGYQEKSINNLLNSINKSKDNPLNQLLFALGIRHIGKKTALDLAQEYGTIEAMMEASVEELEGKNDLGVVKAKSIYDYFKNPKNINLIKELKSHGLKMEFEKIQVDTTSDFYGKTVVVTGTVEGGSREDIKKKLSQLGAKVTSTVSSNTYKLLAGIKPSESKISKIEKSKIIYIKHIKDIDEI